MATNKMNQEIDRAKTDLIVPLGLDKMPNLPFLAGKPASQQSNPNGHKPPSLFEIIKAGLLIPLQNVVEMQPEMLKTRDDKGHTPAHWACLGGHTNILRYIIEMKGPIDEPSENELGAHPIHWACVNGHIAVVDILVQTGVSIDVTDNKGVTPLIAAAQYGKTMLAGYLMGKGARLQICDKDGDNALHWAAFKGHSELMRLLIYSGFNPKQKDNYGQTPLHLACISGDLTSVKELSEQDGVEIDIADNNNKTPLMLARGRKHEEIVYYLTNLIKNKSSFLPRIDFWSIIFGPPGNSKMPLLFFIVNTIFWGYPMYIYKGIPLTGYDLLPLHIIFIFLNIVMWISLYHANSIDPGFLPRNIPEYDMAIKQVAHFAEWKHGKNPLSRLCHTCRTVKPLRSKHCRICQRCVSEFDHHCPYIYNCVGYNNRISFVIFATTIWMNGLLTMVMSATVWTQEGDLLSPTLEKLICLCYAVFFLIVSGSVSGIALFHATKNITTNERINHKRYDYMKDGKGNFYNPFDRGVWHNIKEFLHLRKPLGEEEVQLLNVV